MTTRCPLTRALSLVTLSVTLKDYDEELGLAVGDAIHDRAAWQRVHDRLNVLGAFPAADAVRQAIEENHPATMPPLLG